ncbi:hypothetical protein LB941_07320 [Ligilactobacillus sp. WILCCON 0076]|uniref:Uncharacterized protein n=1 Tax=Ligilactobacillus ubinensis TaxID=2876789 RepID=A0A9X2JLM7_9LACO|nr:hypothetical protein [Ligilactobacillus ubinensis]MCP0887143.1 hypothetical protein [Ligilactobacillus ubinensis]
MRKIEFNEIDSKEIEVLVNGKLYGVLRFDQRQKVWFFVLKDVNNVVRCFKSLEETKEALKDSID